MKFQSKICIILIHFNWIDYLDYSKKKKKGRNVSLYITFQLFSFYCKIQLNILYVAIAQGKFNVVWRFLEGI